jgi:hypothetical protein
VQIYLGKDIELVKFGRYFIGAERIPFGCLCDELTTGIFIEKLETTDSTWPSATNRGR